MRVTIGGYSQPIEHKTMMGSLNHLWEYGNSLRAKKGLTGLDLAEWRRSSQTMELMEALNKKYNMGFSHIIELDQKGRTKGVIDSPFLKTKRGKGGGTWAHLMLMLDAAAYLDADFKVEMYDCFINNKILQWRDESGNEFKNLNVAIDAYLKNINGLDKKDVYIRVAIQLKDKIKPDGNAWNQASFNQLEQRAKIEEKLVGLLELGLINDFNQLRLIIDKL